MITITGQDGTVAGEISEEQFAFLREQFEEESLTDEDYYVDAATLELLEENGADAGLIAVLRAAVGPAGDGEIRWSRG
ncbi:MAG TPA: hypothetical protein VM759_07710 [Longimicrobium sp.]|nr:hypothetical protein [Longimicrobium sp.]